MWTYQILVHFSYLLIYSVQDSKCLAEKGYCQKNNPVVNICTNSTSVMLKVIHIDTFSVPLLQQSDCECIINLSVYQANFIYYFQNVNFPVHMILKINDIELNNTGGNYNIRLTETATLSLYTPANYTTEGVCLVISADDISYFNITCYTSKTMAISSTSTKPVPDISTESPPSETLIKHVTDVKPESSKTITELFTDAKLQTSETSTELVTNAKKLAKQETKTRGMMIIISVVAAIAGLICLVSFILVLIHCKRRTTKKKSTASSSDVGKEEDSDYYMTENLMYEPSRSQHEVQNSDNEHHFSEHKDHGDLRSTDHYDSKSNSPLRNQSPAKVNYKEKQYDHFTRATKKASGSVPNNKSNTDENMYDSTNKDAVKHFQGMNEYDHLRSVGSRKKTIVDIYNTVGNVRNTKHEEEEEEESVYHVTNLRE